MNAAMTIETTPRWREYLGRGLMLLSALGALLAFLSALPTLQAASSQTIWVETWRAAGFLLFAAGFALLALRPRASAGLWELVFFHKTAMALAAVWLPGAREAASAGLVDGILAVLILAAYLLTRAWTGWKRSR